MNNIYLDTNIFIYLSDINSTFHTDCLSLIEYCEKNKILISTCVETIQEIIHFSKNTKQLPTGILIARHTLSLADYIFSIDKTTIEIFLEKAEKYKQVKSRDLIHLSVCVENNLNTVITYDKEFNTFKELDVLYPQDFLNKN